MGYFIESLTDKTKDVTKTVTKSKVKFLEELTEEVERKPRTTYKRMREVITFQLPFITGKQRDTLTKVRNFPTVTKTISHRNNVLIIEKLIQDEKIECLFNDLAKPRITVGQNGYCINYDIIVITVRFVGTDKQVSISHNGELILRSKP